MVIFPNCKVNLGLRVLGKRPDGYHNLETIFLPIPLYDVLELLPSPESLPILSPSGLSIEGPSDSNLCLKAWTMLRKDFPQLPVVNLWLHKVIPMGAGLGGGSADGAFMLKALNEKFQLGLNTPQLMRYALELGSDCPFFIHNRSCLAKGRGEELSPIALSLENYTLSVAFPGIHIPTAWAFQQINPSAGHPQSLQAIVERPPESWKGALVNEFEAPVCRHYPEIESILQTFYSKGAIYAALSGSGSTVFAIFRQDQHPDISFPEHYFVRHGLPLDIGFLTEKK